MRPQSRSPYGIAPLETIMSIVDYLTEQKGLLDINKKSKKGTPFFLEGKIISLIQLGLLGILGADFNLRDNEGRNILFYLNSIDEFWYVGTIKYLIEMLKVDPTIPDAKGKFFWESIDASKLKLLRKENLIPYYSTKIKRVFNRIIPFR